MAPPATSRPDDTDGRADAPTDRLLVAGAGPDQSRPAVGRSTVLLLGVLAWVVLVAGGAVLGRVTAPRPADPPQITGSVESVSKDPDGTRLTVRTPDGKLVVFTATTATVRAPLAGGLDALPRGAPVVVDSEVDGRGGLAATNVLLGSAP